MLLQTVGHSVSIRFVDAPIRYRRQKPRGWGGTIGQTCSRFRVLRNRTRSSSALSGHLPDDCSRILHV